VLPTVALRLVLDSLFAVLRLCALVSSVGLVLLWHGWYTRHPLGLLIAALSAGWSLTFAVAALRRGVGRSLVAANVLVAGSLAVGVRWWLPPELIDDPASGVLLALTHATAVAAWTYSSGRFLAVVVLTGGAATGGTALAGSPSVVPIVIIVTIGLLVRYLLPRLRALAAGVEERLVRVVESREAEHALRMVLRARRERELVIHNAVLNTLTGIAWGGGSDAELTRRRCADGESALRELLGEGDLPGEGDPPGGGDPPGEGDLPGERDLPDKREHDMPDKRDLPGERDLPGKRELLGEEATRGVVAPRRVVAPEAISAVVAAELEAAEWVAPPGSAAEPRWDVRPGSAVAPEASSLRAGYAAQLRRVTSGFALVWLALMAAPAGRVLPHVRSVPLAVLLFAVPLAVAALARRRFRAGPLTSAQAAAVVAVCVLIAVAGAWNAGAGAMRLMSWPMVALPPLVMVVTVSCSPRRWVGAALAVTVAMIAGTLARNPGDPLALSHLVLALHYLWMTQICLVMVGPVLWSTADARAWASRFEGELRQRAEVLDRVRERRRGLLGSIEREVVPLLAEVAAGRLDPRAEAVRTDCGRRAVAVRRLLFDDDAVHGAIGEVIDSAERRGTVVSSQIHGGLDQLPASVRGEFIEQLHHALRVMPSRRVLLTVTADPDAASLFLSCPWPAEQLPPAPAGRDVEMIVDLDDGRLCLELRWPPEPRPALPVPAASSAE
jgi:hypothetical protein